MTDRNAPSLRTDLAARPHAEVLIIGGGINGVATFRDLALQGVDVALVEKNDFISGASAGSSHMIHGGVRYLENGEFRLVHEAVRERNDLIGTAPHYVKPLQTDPNAALRRGYTLALGALFLELARSIGVLGAPENLELAEGAAGEGDALARY